MTATRDDQIAWVAERCHIVVPGAGFSPDEIRHVYDVHAGAARENNQPEMVEKPFFKWIYVDHDERRARKVAEEYFMKTVMAFAHGGQHLFKALSKKIRETWPADKSLEEYGAADMSFEGMTDPSHTPLAYGSPERVRDMLGPCVEAGANFFIGGFNMGVMPPEMVRNSMRLYAEKVMPKL